MLDLSFITTLYLLFQDNQEKLDPRKVWSMENPNQFRVYIMKKLLHLSHEMGIKRKSSNNKCNLYKFN